MKITIIIVKLLFLGGLLILSNYNLHLSNSTERGIFFDSYYVWIGSLFDQGVQLTAYVVKFEWMPRSDRELGKGEIEIKG